MSKTTETETTRRRFMTNLARVFALAGMGSLAHLATRRAHGTRNVWQIDPRKCTQCGLCEISCVRKPSAVKCVHAFSMCGYCKLCFGYFHPNARVLDEMPQHQLCPTGAIKRRFIEDPYFEYTIDTDECIGCAVCVNGCGAFGNGSLHLQVNHNLCLDCNHCNIAEACPSGAFIRVPHNEPYLIKDKLPSGSDAITTTASLPQFTTKRGEMV